MRQMKSVLLGLFILSSFVFVGCGGDDDCLTCPTAREFKALVYSQASLHGNNLDFWAEIRGVDNFAPDIDSIIIAGYTAEMQTYDHSLGNILYANCWENDVDFVSGDTVDVFFYTPGGVCSASVKLLDWMIDRPQVAGWLLDWPYDTVATATNIEIAWPPVANADYYFISCDYSYDSLGNYSWKSVNLILTDTGYTIPAYETTFDGYYYVEINACTGAIPDQGVGNISGKVLEGILYSRIIEDFSIYIGTGNPYPASAGFVSPASADYDPMRELYLNNWNIE